MLTILAVGCLPPACWLAARRGPAVLARRDAARASAMGRPGSLAGWVNSPPKAAPCSRRVWPHTSITLAGCQAATPDARAILDRISRGPRRPLAGVPARAPPAPRIGPPTIPLMGPPRGPLIPPLMGPPGSRGVGGRRHHAVSAGQVAQRGRVTRLFARDPAPLRYVGVPPTCQLGRRDMDMGGMSEDAAGVRTEGARRCGTR